MDEDGEIPLKLRQWRKKRKLSQEKLAAMVGLTQGMISQIETGRSDYLGGHLILLAAALRCSVRDLFRDPDDPSIDAMLEGKPTAVWENVRTVAEAFVEKERE